jgi:hypothetical protein
VDFTAVVAEAAGITGKSQHQKIVNKKNVPAI